MDVDSPIQPCDIEAMQPFGVLVTPEQPRQHVTTVPVALLRELTRDKHLVVLRGFESFADSAAMADYCATWGQIMMWPFGPVLELIEHDEPADQVFDNSYVPLHWDGMYMEFIPEFQVFHCAHALGHDDGGRTTFFDTTKVLADATPQERALWERVTVGYRIDKVAHYGGGVRSPLVTTHPSRGYQVLRYNEPPRINQRLVNQQRLAVEGVPPDEVEAFQTRLAEALYAPEHCYAHAWQQGDVVLTNNFALLHGREAYRSKSGRHLRRVHIHSEPPLRNPALAAR